MMAIRRFRFALLLALVLALSGTLAPDASAHKSVVAQVIPDSDGDGPLNAASGGSHHEREKIAPSKPKGVGLRIERGIPEVLLSLLDWLKMVVLDHEIADPTLQRAKP
jgi:hypothetical protein